MSQILLAADQVISIKDALVIAAMGFAIVFAVLLLLMLIIKLMGIIVEKSPALAAKLPKISFKKKATEAPAAAEENPVVDEPKANGTCGELVLVNTTERDAAMIMAIVADELKTPLNELRFKSIKKIEGEE